MGLLGYAELELVLMKKNVAMEKGWVLVIQKRLWNITRLHVLRWGGLLILIHHLSQANLLLRQLFQHNQVQSTSPKQQSLQTMEKYFKEKQMNLQLKHKKGQSLKLLGLD